MLITKPPFWRYCTTNFPANPSTISFGGSVPLGKNNAIPSGGGSTNLFTLTHDLEYLVLFISGQSTTATNNSALIDIFKTSSSMRVDPPIISGLIAGCNTNNGSTSAFSRVYHFPIWLPSGTNLRCHGQWTGASDSYVSLQIVAFAFGGNSNPGSWWCGSRVTPIGVDTSGSKGQNHTPGNSGTYSSWTDLGSPLPAHTGALQFAVQGTNTNTTTSELAYYFEFGAGGQRIGPPIYRITNTSENGHIIQPGPMFCDLVEGTQLQVRGTCNSTAQTLDVAAYAVH